MRKIFSTRKPFFPRWIPAAFIGAMIGLAIFLAEIALAWIADTILYPAIDISWLDITKAALLWPNLLVPISSNNNLTESMRSITLYVCPPLPMTVLGGLIGYAIKEKDDRSCTIDAIIIALFLLNILMFFGAFYYIRMLASYVD